MKVSYFSDDEKLLAMMKDAGRADESEAVNQVHSVRGETHGGMHDVGVKDNDNGNCRSKGR